jgi:hypothetical protein
MFFRKKKIIKNYLLYKKMGLIFKLYNIIYNYNNLNAEMKGKEILMIRKK